MTHPRKVKGNAAEREAAALLTELLGIPVMRRYNVGTHEDTGDLVGIPECVVQVCDWKDAGRALREKLPEAEEQRQRAGVPFAVTMIRRRGGRYVMAMTPQQFAALYDATRRADTESEGY